ncbi:MAG: hypothetical protein PHI32_02010 [Dysgonamonadaceae bacterium]|nr:hypothetical protein [Dysgonamonadaceae bacterium]MDD4729132.1 hypothetical protein [Dysgonamonadaceae bacterium]
MIRNINRSFAIALISLTLVSCNSMKSDAKKAAILINKSIEKTHELKLKEAEKRYLKAQKIINKYEEKNKTEEFYKLFVAYRDKEKKQNAN